MVQKEEQESKSSSRIGAHRDLTDEEIHRLIDGLCERLSRARRSSALLYLYFPGDIMMVKDHAIEVYDLLRSAGKLTSISIFLDSNGGDIAAAYDIIRLCRHYAQPGEVTVYVPRWAMSAATLIALGADRLVLSKVGRLGPLDPVVEHPELGWMPVRAITDVPKVLEGELESFGRRDLRLKAESIIQPIAEQADPYMHVGYAKTPDVARKYGEKVLLSKNVSKEHAGRCLNHLITVFPIHGYELDADDLRAAVFGAVVKAEEPTKEEEDWMMSLLRAFLILEQKRRARGEDISTPEIGLMKTRKSPSGKVLARARSRRKR